MNSYDEIRLRAVKFQELSGCEIIISPNEILIKQGQYTSVYRSVDMSPAYPAGFFNEWGVLDEEHWIKGIEEVSGGVRFPPLADCLPKDPQPLVDALRGCIKGLPNYSKARKNAVETLKAWEAQ